MNISFIVPAFNESKNIKNIISSIRQFVPTQYQYEIIVVDHGSEDETVRLAEECGAVVLVKPDGTIGGLRNFGVRYSYGNVIVFLDADILLSKEWSDNISEVMQAFDRGDRLLTGSRYSVPESPTWIERYWFNPMARGRNAYINSGHLIISRLLFDEIKGFDEMLETGEDYDISMKARAGGISLIDNTKLRVIHEGYPRSLNEFVRREFWHGKGDALSISVLLQSKVAVAALIFVALHIILAYFSITQNIVATVMVLFVLLSIVIGLAIKKYRKESLITILINSFLYYAYLWARGLSIVALPGLRQLQKRMR